MFPLIIELVRLLRIDDDNDCDSSSQNIESVKIKVTTIHNIETSRFGNEFIQNIDIMN